MSLRSASRGAEKKVAYRSSALSSDSVAEVSFCFCNAEVKA